MTRCAVASFLLAATLLLAFLALPTAADDPRKCHVCTCNPNGDPSK
jgi:hypothetical protein